IRLEVGRKSFPLTLELSDVRFSSIVRVELTPLMPQFPCFGAITICFMKKPFMDFSFKVGSLDVMNLGPADYNVASVVNNIIRSIVDGVMVYPKKLVVPMVSDVDMKKLTTPAPVGLLVLTIVGAKKLRVADMFSSDPFLSFHYMDV
ncbi:SYT3, partial [Symbiodinium microadriaticum]